MNKQTSILIILALAAILVISGCSKPAEKSQQTSIAKSGDLGTDSVGSEIASVDSLNNDAASSEVDQAAADLESIDW